MAARPFPIGLALAAGLAGALVALVIGASFVALAGAGFAITGADLRLLGFTAFQAVLSALISVLLAIPLARALARRRFPGRALLIRALMAPFLLPVVVAVVALTAFLGRQGPVNALLAALGLPPFSLYGLQGILIAHVFFNLPLALRMLLGGWTRVPAEHMRLAQMLRLGPWARFRTVEWPMLIRVAPQALAAIFLICLTSFVIILTLGGGPRTTTLELGIYQALRFDFLPGRAAGLALLQLALGLGAALLALRLGQGKGGAGLDRAGLPDPSGRLVDWLVLALGSLFLLTPLALLLPAVPGLFDLPPSLWPASLRALGIGLGSAAVTLILALPLALWIATGQRFARAAEALGLMPLAVSPLVLGTGLYLILHRHLVVGDHALTLAALITGILLQPFFLKLVIPPIRESHDRFAPLAATLRLSLMAQITRIHLPRARREIAEGTGLVAALAAGEMSVLALLAPPDRPSLPIAVHQLVGAYRTDQALSAALLLIMLSLALFTLFAALGGRRA